ncbi:CASP-like protein 4B4 [Ananas comosus]|uniref:CASP-like protein n=1 Tax=Ananas comosus TaxID=4615 RepID=A0A199V8Q3_ANACO|nr:CASP-like protein 4B4 [Ananas comosus]
MATTPSLLPQPESAAPKEGAAAAAADGGGGGVVAAVLRRWRREDLLERGSLLLRGSAWVFSLIALVVMASNKHGDWRDFHRYQEYRIDPVRKPTAEIIDFAGDQLMAYLLISALSAAIPLTDRLHRVIHNTFVDSCAASISMAFFAFVALALSALVSGFRLSKQSYI